MRPESLNFPFSSGKSVLNDRIFYVGEGNEEFHFPGWSHPELFGNDQPIHLEYCSGNGLWIASKAAAYPNINWIAIEIKFSRARKIWSKIKNMKLNNLIVVCGEAFYTTQKYFSSNSISNAYINFPDPWPKRRHARHRLIQPRFVDEVCRIIQPEGVFTLVTDDIDYSERMLKEMVPHSGFKSSHPAPYYITELEGYGTSSFDRLWREKGKSIRYHQFICKKK